MNLENQHIIAQVYLKGFGYKDKNNQWRVSALDKNKVAMMEKHGKKWISQKSIESFLSENDIFDLVLTTAKVENIYEEFNKNIETNYLKIISDLDSYKSLSDLGKTAIYCITINLLIRSLSFRSAIDQIIQGSARDHLLYEIFSSIKNGKYLAKGFEIIPKESELNYISLMLWERIMPIFSEFQYSILATDKNEGWFTSDNPVVIKNFVTEDTIFSRNAQVIFPIDRQYLAYFHHPSNKFPDFPNYRQGDVTVCEPSTKNEIIKQIMNNAGTYFIFPDEFYWVDK
jgi:hypothetical protein